MEKSVDAFRTISEVADDLELPQHVLRFWETRFTQIRPLKRAGGRRYYRPADVSLLRNIRHLLYDKGYTIKGVQRLLKDKGEWVRADHPAPVESSGIIEAGAIALNDHPSDRSRETPGGTGAPHAPERPEHDHIREALALIEECRRILAAVGSPNA